MLATTTQAVRVRPVPRSEPLTDEERRDSGLVGPSGRSPLSDKLLPPDLATGVRVRRGVRSRSPNGSRPSRQTPAAGAGPIEPPTLLRAPQTVVAVVTAPLHTAPVHTAPPHTEPLRPSADPVSAAAAGAEPTRHAPNARELRLAARRLLGTCLEVIDGFRPITQLRPYCAPERFEAIVNRLLRPIGTGHGQGATRASVIARAIVPPKPGRPGHTPPRDRVVVRRVQICDVMEGVAELAVVLSRREHTWAMAMRLERNRGQWRCMHLEVL
jgi:hypothetical protein